MLHPPIPFPIHAFPDLVQRAAHELIRETGAADDLVAMSLLGAMSTATQWGTDVRLPHGPVRPTSLSLVTLADRGDRKSSVDKLTFRQHYELERKIADLAAKRSQQIKTAREIWRALRKRFVAEIARLELNGESTAELRARLCQHDASEPTTPRAANLMLTNATIPAFVDAIEGDGHAIVLISDEGEMMLNSQLFGSSGVLNKAWDGDGLIPLNRAKGSVIARNPRVSVILMVQPPVWQKFMHSERGRAMHNTGFCARMLMGLIISNQGFRPPPSLTSYEGPAEFHAMVDNFAHKYLDRLELQTHAKREVLELCLDAKMLLRDRQIALEPNLAPGRGLHETRDFASKYGEHVCRVAASLHAFSPDQGLEISAENAQRATAIVNWFGDQFSHIFDPHGPLSPLAADAQKLLTYVQRHYWEGHQVARLSVIGREGPVRGKSHVMACVEYLVRHQMARLVTAPSHGQTLQPPGFSIGVV